MSYVSKFLGVLRRIKEALINMIKNGKKTISRKSMKEILDSSKTDDQIVNEAIEELSEEILPEAKVEENGSESKGQAKVLVGVAGKDSESIPQFVQDIKE